MGFADKAETRRLLGLGCERQWFRGWVLYLQGVPCAFWDGLLYGRTFLTSTTGYDPAYHEYRLGNFLLQKVVEDLIQNETAETVDFGFGDAQYKQDLCDVRWQETALYWFMPTFKGLSANLMRTPVMMLDQEAENCWRGPGCCNGSSHSGESAWRQTVLRGIPRLTIYDRVRNPRWCLARFK